MSTPQFVFDMDGVLIDSEPVKQAAFVEAVAEVCAPDAAALDAVAAYNAAHRGEPRDAKIAYVVREILGAPAGVAPAVAARYADLLAERAPLCPPLRGAAAFLASVDADLHVASSAPVAEVRANLERHGLLRHFSSVSGHPRTKIQTLSILRRSHPSAAVVFFGDAPADLDAARRAGVKFVAVNPNDALRPRIDRWVPDFADVDRVLDAVRDAA